MNFYKHYLGDYDGHTAHLSWDEDMAYTRLMRAYYRREVPIPDAEKYRLARAGSKAQRAAVDSVLAEFFVNEGGAWRQKRCDEEIAAYQAQAETNRRIARERTVQRSVHESSTKGTPNQIPEARSQKGKNGAAAPPMDPVKVEIWQTGKALLEGQGMSRQAAGSFLGKQCKDYGQKLVLEAIRDCVRVTPAEPSSWLVARCQERRAQSGNKQSALEARNAAAAAEWLEKYA